VLRRRVGRDRFVRLLAEALAGPAARQRDRQRVAGLPEDEVGPDRWRNPFPPRSTLHPDERRCLQGRRPHDSLVLTGDALADHCFESLHGVPSCSRAPCFGCSTSCGRAPRARCPRARQSGYLSQDHLDCITSRRQGIADDPDAMVAFLRQDPQFRNVGDRGSRRDSPSARTPGPAAPRHPGKPDRGTSGGRSRGNPSDSVGWRRRPGAPPPPWSVSAHTPREHPRFARRAPPRTGGPSLVRLVDEEAALSSVRDLLRRAYLDDSSRTPASACAAGETRWRVGSSIQATIKTSSAGSNGWG